MSRKVKNPDSSKQVTGCYCCYIVHNVYTLYKRKYKHIRVSILYLRLTQGSSKSPSFDYTSQACFRDSPTSYDKIFTVTLLLNLSYPTLQ